MRKTRAGKNNSKDPKHSNKIEKIYYVVIGLLLVILGGLVIFIFANQNDVVTEDESNGSPESEIVSETDDTEDEEEAQEETDTDQADETDEEEADETDDPAESEETDQSDDEATDEQTEDEPEEDTDQDAETDEEADEDDADTEDADEDDEETADASINPDAPLNEGYTINFGDGSSDRNAIEENASAVSGVSRSNMITWWVGNNGPGRAFTVVSDSDRNNVHRVYLQYGDGNWHVTAVEELDSVPAEYR